MIGIAGTVGGDAEGRGTEHLRGGPGEIRAVDAAAEGNDDGIVRGQQVVEAPLAVQRMASVSRRTSLVFVVDASSSSIVVVVLVFVFVLFVVVEVVVVVVIVVGEVELVVRPTARGSCRIPDSSKCHPPRSRRCQSRRIRTRGRSPYWLHAAVRPRSRAREMAASPSGSSTSPQRSDYSEIPPISATHATHTKGDCLVLRYK